MAKQHDIKQLAEDLLNGAVLADTDLKNVFFDSATQISSVSIRKQMKSAPVSRSKKGKEKGKEKGKVVQKKKKAEPEQSDDDDIEDQEEHDQVDQHEDQEDQEDQDDDNEVKEGDKITVDNMWDILIAPLGWCDKDESEKTKAMVINAIPNANRRLLLRNFITFLTIDLKKNLERFDDFIELDMINRLNVLAHIVAKGQLFLNMVIEEPSLALYLIQEKNYQRLWEYLS
jgi:hypothetical protein